MVKSFESQTFETLTGVFKSMIHTSKDCVAKWRLATFLLLGRFCFQMVFQQRQFWGFSRKTCSLCHRIRRCCAWRGIRGWICRVRSFHGWVWGRSVITRSSCDGWSARHWRQDRSWLRRSWLWWIGCLESLALKWIGWCSGDFSTVRVVSYVVLAFVSFRSP